MTKKMSKYDAKKRCKEIIDKMYKMFGAEYATAKDYTDVRTVIQRIRNRVNK